MARFSNYEMTAALTTKMFPSMTSVRFGKTVVDCMACMHNHIPQKTNDVITYPSPDLR